MSSPEPPINILDEDKSQQWAYDMYPERRQNRGFRWKDLIFNYVPRGRSDRYRCEKMVYEVLKRSPLLRIMVSAMEKNGCPIDYKRHISCEYCEPYVTGGYDPIQNQVVVCHNTCWSKGIVNMVLYHEFIHMFDNCVHKLDFHNIEHLACTEIRAANLTYCNYLSAFMTGNICRTSLKRQQRECVKKRAIDSIMSVREITLEEAETAVRKVFKKCYNDMEPIGRRIRPKGFEADLAYAEAYLLGYD